jgi:hypothetical protein
MVRFQFFLLAILFMAMLSVIRAQILDPDTLQAAVDALEYIYQLTTTDIPAIPGYILSNLGIFGAIVQNAAQVASAYAGDYMGDAEGGAEAMEAFISTWIAPWVPI